MIPLATIAAAITKRVPAPVLWATLGTALMLGAVWAHGAAVDRYGAAEYARGKRDARGAYALDSALRAPFTQQRLRAEAKTDTLIRYVRAASRDVAAAIGTLPDSVKALPAVARLVVACETLVSGTAAVPVQIDAERATALMERDLMAGQLRAAHVVVAQKTEENQVLAKRPTRSTLAKVGVLGVVVGAAAKPIIQVLTGGR